MFCITKLYKQGQSFWSSVFLDFCVFSKYAGFMVDSDTFSNRNDLQQGNKGKRSNLTPLNTF